MSPDPEDVVVGGPDAAPTPDELEALASELAGLSQDDLEALHELKLGAAPEADAAFGQLDDLGAALEDGLEDGLDAGLGGASGGDPPPDVTESIVAGIAERRASRGEVTA